MVSSALCLSTATAPRRHLPTRFARLHSPYGLLTTHKASSMPSATFIPYTSRNKLWPLNGSIPERRRLVSDLDRRSQLSLKNPRVTVIGGGTEAYVDKLAAQLPDPLLYDDEMRRLAKALREPFAPEADEHDPAEGLV